MQHSQIDVGKLHTEMRGKHTQGAGFTHGISHRVSLTGYFSVSQAIDKCQIQHWRTMILSSPGKTVERPLESSASLTIVLQLGYHVLQTTQF